MDSKKILLPWPPAWRFELRKWRHDGPCPSKLDQLAEMGAGEAAQILARFSDRQEVAPWAANALAVSVKAGKSSA